MKWTKIFFVFFVLITNSISLSAKLKEQEDLTIFSYVLHADGLGRIAPEIIDAFSNEFKINLFLTRDQKLNNIPQSYHTLIKNRNNGKILFFIDWLMNYDPKYFRNCKENSIKIAYSMWESTQNRRF